MSILQPNQPLKLEPQTAKERRDYAVLQSATTLRAIGYSSDAAIAEAYKLLDLIENPKEQD